MVKYTYNAIEEKLDIINTADDFVLDFVRLDNTNWLTLTNDSMADSLHRHSELSASDGSPNPAVQVDAGGNVGIGTTAPSDLLEIKMAGIAATQQFTGNDLRFTYAGVSYIRNSNASGEIDFGAGAGVGMIRLKTDGKVGIGNTDPTYMVDVNTASNTGIRAKSTNAGGESQTIAWNDADKYVTMKQYGSNIGGTLFGVTRNNLATLYNVADNFAIGNYFDTPFILGVNNTEYARINAGGNFGIRTTTPRQALDVAGNITASNYYIRSGDNTYSGRLVDGGTYLTLDAYNGNDWTSRNMRIQGNEIYFLDGATTEVMRIKSGKVGIGTSSPTTTFQVSGNTILNGSLVVQSNTTISGNFAVTGDVSIKVPYAMFSSTQTQTIGSVNTSLPVTFNTVEDTHQITISGGSVFNFQQPGDYLINISAIAQTTTPGNRMQIWPCKNGSDVPRSNTIYDFKSANSNAIIAFPFIFDVASGDKLCMRWAGDSTNITMPYIGSTSYSPATPSIIITMNKISEITP